MRFQIFRHLFLTIFLTALLPLIGADCDADVNLDGMVDAQDLALVQGAWGSACNGCSDDVDADGQVTILDIFATISAQGATCFMLTSTELAGRSLAQFPHFEYVLAFNQGEGMEVAVDTSRFPYLIGETVDLYVVEAKTFEQWDGDNQLIDVTGDGFQTINLVDGPITANTFAVSGSPGLDSDAGLGLGRPYDVILDFNQNGFLDGRDVIDGLGDPAEYGDRRDGFYVVHDLTQPGPLAVTQVNYSAQAGTVTAGFEQEVIFYPTNIAGMGALPLIIVSHGNGHNYQWYDHIGNHMASYGYVVMSHANNTVPGVFTASTTTLEHTDAFLNQLPMIDGGALVGHVDANRMVWLGHSRGGEGVAIAVDRIFDGDWVPQNYDLGSLALVSSIAPVDFLTGDQTDPHGTPYHLWTGGADADVNGCASCNLCQTFHLHDRATDYRQSISLHGAGHGAFHNGNASLVATGPCLLTREETHDIMRGHFLPLVKHYVEGNVPGRDFLWRQWESFRPIGAPTGPCIVVDLMFREGESDLFRMIDDYQGVSDPAVSSQGQPVTFDVTDLTEGLFDDGNGTFSDDAGDPMNGVTLGGTGDTTAGVVFSFDADRFYQVGVPAALRDFSSWKYLQFRAAQATRHPLTTAVLEDLTFDLVLVDGMGRRSVINIGAFGGGIEEPYQRPDCGSGEGWANEFETIRIRVADFANSGADLDLTEIVAVRFEFGPSHGSPQGRLALDEIGLSKDQAPLPTDRLSIALQGAIPALIPAGQELDVTVEIDSGAENLVPGSAMVFYRLDGGVYQSQPLNDMGANLYSATLPAVSCGDELELYFAAQGDLSGTLNLPREAPGSVFSANVGTRTVFFTETMDVDPAWTTEGQWAFGQNTGGGGSSGNPDPTEGATGDFVYGYNLNGDYGNNIPEHHLTTSAIDCTGRQGVQLAFQRFLGVEHDQFDHAYVRVSTNGVDFVTVWENGGTSIADADWSEQLIDISALADNQATVFIRWTMGDTDTAVVYCGWNVDDVALSSFSCP